MSKPGHYKNKKRSFAEHTKHDPTSYNKKRKFDHHHHPNKNDNEQKHSSNEWCDALTSINVNRPRSWTVSVAIPGSVMETAKTPQLQSYLASQFARIVSIFCVDEIVIFSETASTIKEKPNRSDCNLFFVRLLRYLETPQYLRRSLFAVHSDFRYVGMCRPLRTPHHLNKNELCPYREGIVLKKRIIHPKQQQQQTIADDDDEGDKKNEVSIVDIGLDIHCVIDQKLEENARVTVAVADYKQEMMKKSENEYDEYYYGEVCAKQLPMQKDGIYWGYKTRFAQDVGEVLTHCTYENGYDWIIGTSDKGKDVYNESFNVPKFQHLLIVFGGPNGLESCVLKENNNQKLEKPELLFDDYINVCPFQGTRTIRSEE
eukprot:CAMPEP_0202729786 /NCGR_PEP_ID=MMETSP1385-20130828/186313_1 /ASSEMBLY_ACC=CAM_ASM_000861 /TAXON_ID=933848 /ORGANISM="Elphidium margaritaceum" /LENGTH=371 /DNA_ID=CAMNT_0049396057 /DNA_START=29 /DNA_END=1141 /DNA_ORIENTATION=+